MPKQVDLTCKGLIVVSTIKEYICLNVYLSVVGYKVNLTVYWQIGLPKLVEK